MKKLPDHPVALVTGSATGLGAQVARRLAHDGARIVINYTKSEKEAKETAALCEKEGAEVIMVRGDVASDEDCRSLAEAALVKWGRIDILVNNAGTTKFAAHADLEALSSDDFVHLYKVNVVGAFQMVRAVAPAMKKQGYGAVVNVSSIAGVTGIGSSVAYCASKGALNIMTASLARALAPEIRVNAVCPGFIGTRWFKDRFGDEIFAGMIEQQEKTMPLEQAGTPDLVADAVIFFCGEGARHITGETLLSDAGMHLGGSPFAAK